MVVGHDWGGLIAWTMASYFPKVVRRLAAVSVPHPLRLRAAVLSDPLGQGRRSGYTLGFQLPLLPERQLLRDGAQRVGRMLGSWSGPGWPDQEIERRYRAAMCIPSVAHSSLEYHRWFLRSRLRPDGLRYARAMRAPIQAPTLHLHGSLDGCVLPSAARGSGRYVDAPYRWRLIDGAGHFPHEELPDRFDIELRSWLVAAAGTEMPPAGPATPGPATGSGDRWTARHRASRRFPTTWTWPRPRPSRSRSNSLTMAAHSMPTTCWRDPGASPRPTSVTYGRAWPS